MSRSRNQPNLRRAGGRASSTARSLRTVEQTHPQPSASSAMNTAIMPAVDAQLTSGSQGSFSIPAPPKSPEQSLPSNVARPHRVADGRFAADCGAGAGLAASGSAWSRLRMASAWLLCSDWICRSVAIWAGVRSDCARAIASSEIGPPATAAGSGSLPLMLCHYDSRAGWRQNFVSFPPSPHSTHYLVLVPLSRS